jgi:hypothetical protein
MMAMRSCCIILPTILLLLEAAAAANGNAHRMAAGALTCYEGWAEGDGMVDLHNFTAHACSQHQVDRRDQI